MTSVLSIWLVVLSLAAWGAIHRTCHLRTPMPVPRLLAKGKPTLVQKG